MAEDVVIRAETLGKKYVIGHQAAERTTTLRDAITRSTRQWARSVRDIAKGAANVSGDEIEEFWALRDVSFEIHRGDVVGIVGRNGAGKSTLLKVLSRITEPSEGRVEIKGRVASLLEVGTGFHPELSGRENIYLNGAILGMSHAEIRKKFEEIVAFAEIEKFLDTPVKRYSSGMYVRLAFAVAAHLEPEILIVDEVLAVGDSEFQKKCLGKMQDVAGHGRTVLFVSHNMAAIQRLCRTAMLLEGGKLRQVDRASKIVDIYHESSYDSTAKSSTSKDAYFHSPSIAQRGRTICITGTLDKHPKHFVIAVRVLTLSGEELLWTAIQDDPNSFRPSEGNVGFQFDMPNLLAPTEYWVELVTFLHNEKYIIAPDCGPRIRYTHPLSAGGSAFFVEKRPGLLSPLIRWNAYEAVSILEE